MKKRLTGIVTSDKMNKSLRVEVARLYRHAQYGKIVRGRTICHVHDEENQAKVGDTVTLRAPRGSEQLEIVAVRYDDLR